MQGTKLSINQTKEKFLMKNITTVKSLIELADYLNDCDEKNAELISNGNDNLCNYIDTTSLPTFGGNEPNNTLGVWSWDEMDILVKDDIGWKTQNRCKCGEADFNCKCGED